MKKLSLPKTLLAAASVLAVSASSALAVPTLYIDFGDNDSIDAIIDFTAIDNAGGDQSPTAGRVTGEASLGGQSVSVTGTTKPLSGTASNFRLSSVGGVIGGPGTVAIYFFENGFNSGVRSFEANFAVTGIESTGGGTARYGTFAFADNRSTITPFMGLGGSLTTQAFGQADESGSAQIGVIPFANNPFTLLQKVLIAQDAGTTEFTANLTANVPDGGMTVTLLGLALAGLEGIRRKMGMA